MSKRMSGDGIAVRAVTPTCVKITARLSGSETFIYEVDRYICSSRSGVDGN